MLLSVKGGKFKASDIRDLIGVVLNNKAQMGGLISFDEPIKDMKEEINRAGYYKTSENVQTKILKIQYFILNDILNKNKLFEIPKFTK